MNCVANEDSAAPRARWLAELAEALKEARCMAEALTAQGVPESAELSFRIRAAALEVESMRLRRRERADWDRIDPDWMENLPWKRNA